MHNIPEPGKIYEVVKPFRTMAGVDYKVGDHLELIEPTGRNPFGFQSKLCNWVVKCKHFSPPDDQTVWSGIYIMIENGTIRALDRRGYRG